MQLGGIGFLIWPAIFQHRVHQFQKTMRDRNTGLGFAQRPYPSVKLPLEDRVALPRCCPTRLDQRSQQESVAFLDTRGFTFAGRLIIAWTDSRPTAQVLGALKLTHVRPD